MVLNLYRFEIWHPKYEGKTPKATESNCRQNNTQCKMLKRKFSLPPPHAPKRTFWVNHGKDRVKNIHRTESNTFANISSTFHQKRSTKFSLFQGRNDIQI